jgi:hypothetical protein
LAAGDVTGEKDGIDFFAGRVREIVMDADPTLFNAGFQQDLGPRVTRNDRIPRQPGGIAFGQNVDGLLLPIFSMSFFNVSYS